MRRIAYNCLLSTFILQDITIYLQVEVRVADAFLYAKLGRIIMMTAAKRQEHTTDHLSYVNEHQRSSHRSSSLQKVEIRVADAFTVCQTRSNNYGDGSEYVRNTLQIIYHTLSNINEAPTVRRYLLMVATTVNRLSIICYTKLNCLPDTSVFVMIYAFVAYC